MELSYFEYGLLFIIASILLYWYGTRGLDHFKKKNIEHKKPYPFIGNMDMTFFSKDHLLVSLDKFYQSFPGQKYVGFYEFSKPCVWLRDSEVIKQVTVKDFDHFVDHRNTFSQNIDPLYSNGVFALQGQKWREMRSTLSPAFTGAKMRLMYPLIEKCSVQLSEYIEDELKMTPENSGMAEIEAKDLFTRYANDVIASCAFGLEINSLKCKSDEFYLMGMKITDYTFWFFMKMIAMTVCPKLMTFLGVSAMKKDEADFFRNIVKDTMRFRDEKGIKRPDMIQLLMEAKKGVLKCDPKEAERQPDDASSNVENVTKRVWSDDELAAQAFVFFLGGFESTSTIMSYAAYEIATRPREQQKLRQEVDLLLANNSALTNDSISKVDYMDMFISECLRFWPPVIGVDRVCVKPYTLPPPNDSVKTGYQVNVGDLLMIPIKSIHRDPNYFPQPDEFRPERFSEANKSSIKPFSYLPFGAGPRACIGSRFALMEVKTVLIHLLAKYELVPCSKTEDPSTAKMGMAKIVPTNGIWIGVKRRVGK